MKNVLFLLLILLTILPIQSQNLDLREANVTDVTYSFLQDNTYDFAVTLYHDDDGEAPKYADAWLVEDLNGNELGIRILAHSHGTEEFTRSGNIVIENSIDIIVVRGRDQIHGFGGQVIIVKMSTAEKVFIEQGSEPIDFSNYTWSDISSISILPATIKTESNSVPFKNINMIMGLIVVIIMKKR